MNLEPDELRKEIDEVLEEIDRVEAEVLELFADIGGPEALEKVVAYKRQQERQSPLRGVLPPDDGSEAPAKPEALPEPGTSPPATR